MGSAGSARPGERGDSAGDKCEGIVVGDSGVGSLGGAGGAGEPRAGRPGVALPPGVPGAVRGMENRDARPALAAAPGAERVRSVPAPARCLQPELASWQEAGGRPGRGDLRGHPGIHMEIKWGVQRPSRGGARRRCRFHSGQPQSRHFQMFGVNPKHKSKSRCWALTPRGAGTLRLGVGVEQRDGGHSDPQNITEPRPGGSAPLRAGGFPGVGNLMGWWWPPGAHPAAPLQALSLCHGHHEGSLGSGAHRAPQRLPGEGAAAGGR